MDASWEKPERQKKKVGWTKEKVGKAICQASNVKVQKT
jgi:hypothetical protein